MNYMKALAYILLFAFLLIGCSADNQASITESEYDFVIASGGGYNIVATLRPDMVGVVDDNGNWIHELSRDHPFINEDGQIVRMSETVVVSLGGAPVTLEQREFARRNDIRHSYRHYEGAIFSLIRTNRPTNRVADHTVNVVSLRHYDARNNVILD